MGIGHTPYGYRIKNGMAEIDEAEAGRVRRLYTEYLSGKGYVQAAEDAGLKLCHGSAKRMMQNMHYLGDDFYPPIIDRETFDAAEAERMKRAKSLGRIFEDRGKKQQDPVPTRFWMQEATEFFEDPFRKAEYIYSLIESEE